MTLHSTLLTRLDVLPQVN